MRSAVKNKATERSLVQIQIRTFNYNTTNVIIISIIMKEIYIKN